MKFFDRISKYDDYNTAKILNYPSKGIASFIGFFSILSAFGGFCFSNMLLGHWVGNIYSKLFFALILSSGFLIFIILGYYYCFKPIRYYEQKYGVTGLGDKFIKRWKKVRE